MILSTYWVPCVYVLWRQTLCLGGADVVLERENKTGKNVEVGLHAEQSGVERNGRQENGADRPWKRTWGKYEEE